MKNKAKFLVGFLVAGIAVDISAADQKEEKDWIRSRVGIVTYNYPAKWQQAPAGSLQQQEQSLVARLGSLQMGKEMIRQAQMPIDPMREQLFQTNRQFYAQVLQNKKQAAAANKPEQTKEKR
jgi:hypothetical protein